jgi:hypothetical protein
MGRIFCRNVMLVVAPILTLSAARSSAAQASAPMDKLEPFAFLAGSCWKGTFAGRAVTDEHCFAWVYGGRFLRDRHVVRGDSVPYEGETTYAWDAQQKQIVYWYIALPGFYSHGNVDATDGALLFRDNVVTSTPRQLRTTWRRSTADAYTVLVEEVTNDKSKELWSMVMRRSHPSPE